MLVGAGLMALRTTTNGDPLGSSASPEHLSTSKYAALAVTVHTLSLSKQARKQLIYCRRLDKRAVKTGGGDGASVVNHVWARKQVLSKCVHGNKGALK
ncbi:hypothetical protein J6590_003441 [Homalodisca vitripennis]|nr:hypothetical protein J6590_003441 [Homalodisca vitripennis]